MLGRSPARAGVARTPEKKAELLSVGRRKLEEYRQKRAKQRAASASPDEPAAARRSGAADAGPLPSIVEIARAPTPPLHPPSSSGAASSAQALNPFQSSSAGAARVSAPDARHPQSPSSSHDGRPSTSGPSPPGSSSGRVLTPQPAAARVATPSPVASPPGSRSGLSPSARPPPSPASSSSPSWRAPPAPAPSPFDPLRPHAPSVPRLSSPRKSDAPLPSPPASTAGAASPRSASGLAGAGPPAGGRPGPRDLDVAVLREREKAEIIAQESRRQTDIRNREIDRLLGELRSRQATIERLQGERGTLEARVAEAAARTAALEGELAATRDSAAADLRERCAALERRCAELEESGRQAALRGAKDAEALSELRAACERAEQARNRARAEAREAGREVERAGEERAGMERRVAQQEAMIGELLEEKALLTEALGARDRAIAELEAERAAAGAASRKQGEALMKALHERQELEGRLQGKASEAQALSAELQRARAALAEAHRKLQEGPAAPELRESERLGEEKAWVEGELARARRLIGQLTDENAEMMTQAAEQSRASAKAMEEGFQWRQRHEEAAAAVYRLEQELRAAGEARSALLSELAELEDLRHGDAGAAGRPAAGLLREFVDAWSQAGAERAEAGVQWEGAPGEAEAGLAALARLRAVSGERDRLLLEVDRLAEENAAHSHPHSHGHVPGSAARAVQPQPQPPPVTPRGRREELAGLAARVAELKARNGELERALEERNYELAVLLRAHEEAAAREVEAIADEALLARNGQLQEALAAAEEEARETRRELSAQRRRGEELAARVRQLEAELAEAAAALAKQRSHNAALQQSLAREESCIGELAEERDRAAAEAEELRAERSRLMTALAVQARREERLQEELGSLRQRLELLAERDRLSRQMRAQARAFERLARKLAAFRSKFQDSPILRDAPPEAPAPPPSPAPSLSSPSPAEPGRPPLESIPSPLSK
eukprot:tig00000821_g4483.t1